jgi:hypothetical protein
VLRGNPERGRRKQQRSVKSQSIARPCRARGGCFVAVLGPYFGYEAKICWFHSRRDARGGTFGL